jgi:multidrug efflux pump
LYPARAQRSLGAHGVCDHGGLIVATVLTLLFVPALYAAWFGVRAPQAGAKRGESQLTPVASPSS